VSLHAAVNTNLYQLFVVIASVRNFALASPRVMKEFTELVENLLSRASECTARGAGLAKLACGPGQTKLFHYLITILIYFSQIKKRTYYTAQSLRKNEKSTLYLISVKVGYIMNSRLTKKFLLVLKVFLNPSAYSTKRLPDSTYMQIFFEL